MNKFPQLPFHYKKRSLVLAMGLVLPMMVSASVPLLPALVFDEFFAQNEQTASQQSDPYANLNDELLPAKPIDEKAVGDTLDAIKNAYQEAYELIAPNQTGNEPVFATFNTLDGTASTSTPVARLAGGATPVGLDVGFVQNKGLPNAQSALSNVHQPLNPDEFLPNYQTSPIPKTAQISETPIVKKRPNLLKQAYRKFFKDGEGVLSKIDVKIYRAIPNEVAQNELDNLANDKQESDGELAGVFENDWQFESDRLASLTAYNDNVTLKSVDIAKEPYKNIVNALADVSEESVADFASSIPRLRELVVNASRAVGYYEVAFGLKQEADGTVAVIVYNVGEPVAVSTQTLDIRGAGAVLPSFEHISETAKPKVGQTFHHGDYETTKTAIDQASVEHGFFDGKWLSNSVDVLLPDNTADISLVYDTGERYVFDEVVFFTLDPATGELTSDPSKLPVNLSLLQKMVGFKPNQAFNRSQVTKLSNELTATRYFNASNVETVLPSIDNASLNFEQGAGSQTVDENKSTTVNQPTGDLPLLSPTNGNKTDDDNVPMVITDEEGQVLVKISPIDFSPSQAISEKVALVKSKAERLLNSPDDRVLNENPKKATSILGRVSNAIQGVVQKILPDESKDERPALAEGQLPPVLADKKSAGQVFADKKVPLYVFVMADKPKDAQIGIGYGSDSGYRLTGKLEHHLINKKGFQGGVELGFAEKQKSVNAYLSRPLTHPVNDKATASIKFEQNDFSQNNLDAQTNSLETAFVRTRIKDNSWHRNYYLKYRLDDLKSNANPSVIDDLPIRFLASGAKQEALLAGYSMSKTTQNSLIAPTFGYRQSYSVEMGGRGVGSDANMLFLRAGAGGVYSFGSNQWGSSRANQLVGRLDLGYLWTDNFAKVPYRLRYFAGGDQSVRGYNVESLSPVGRSGYLTGGQALAVGSIEYNRELKEGLRGAVFADVGNAYDKHFKNDTKIGLGVGVRYASPVGTIRVDLAKGVADNKEATPLKIHFLIGLPF